MDNNLKIILKQFEEHKGQFVITDWNVQRLIAIGTDDTDYYYVYYNGRKATWSTCVGTFTPLKGFIDDKHYNEFIRMAKLNHQDQPTIWGGDGNDLETLKMNAHAKAEVENINLPDKYLTEICWELN